MDAELKTMLDKRIAQRDELLARVAPLREKRDALREKIAPLEALVHELNQHIKRVEQPALHDMNRAIDVLRAAVEQTP